MDEPVGPADDGPSGPATFWGRAMNRPRASFSDALAAGGGVIVTIGVLLIAADRYANSGDGWQGALVFVGLFLIANLALLVLREPFDAACTARSCSACPPSTASSIFRRQTSLRGRAALPHPDDRHVGVAVRGLQQPRRPILLRSRPCSSTSGSSARSPTSTASANPVPSPTFATERVVRRCGQRGRGCVVPSATGHARRPRPD